jgi:P-type Cu+ transporter
MATKQITLPITGMTCANCAATIERNLKKLPATQNVSVNLASERASLEFDPAQLGQSDILARIEKAGYGVAMGEVVLPIKRLSDESDAQRLERALSNVEGVVKAHVSYATEKATVTYIPTVVSQTDLRRAVSEAGFEAVVVEGSSEDAERIAREREIRHQQHLLIIGLIFTVPLFAQQSLWWDARDVASDARYGPDDGCSLV